MSRGFLVLGPLDPHAVDLASFLTSAAPLALLAGGAFAMVQQGFKWVWRLAQVEQQSRENRDEIERVEQESRESREEIMKTLAALPRIEVFVQQLIEDRRSGTDRRVHS